MGGQSSGEKCYCFYFTRLLWPDLYCNVIILKEECLLGPEQEIASRHRLSSYEEDLSQPQAEKRNEFDLCVFCVLVDDFKYSPILSIMVLNWWISFYTKRIYSVKLMINDASEL